MEQKSPFTLTDRLKWIAKVAIGWYVGIFLLAIIHAAVKDQPNADAQGDDYAEVEFAAIAGGALVVVVFFGWMNKACKVMTGGFSVVRKDVLAGKYLPATDRDARIFGFSDLTDAKQYNTQYAGGG